MDKNGGIVSHALKGGELQRSHIALEPVLQFIAGDAQYPIRAGDPRNSSVDKIFSAAEVTTDNGLQGYLYVVLGGKIYDDIGQGIAWSHIGSQMFWSLLIVVASSILIGLLIFRLLILRLNRLTVKMTDFARTELGEGNLLSGNRLNDDEVDKIEHVFHAMSGKISAQLEQLRDTDRLRRELISNVSHDLRTPLATIQGYVETLIMKMIL